MSRHLALKVQHILMYMLHIDKTQIIIVFQVLKCFQMLNLFVTYTDGSNMHTGQAKPQSMNKEYISGKIVLDNSNNKYKFPVLNVSNNFATIGYDAHINTTNYYTINHDFRFTTVQELKTIHTIRELERNQLLTILTMSVQNPQPAGFLLTVNRTNFFYVEGSTAFTVVHTFFLLYTKLIDALIVYLCILKYSCVQRPNYKTNL